MNSLPLILIGFIVLGIIWVILKTVLKFTVKVFSCGLLTLVGVVLVVLILTGKIF